MLTAEQKAQFDRDGYVIVSGLFSPEEADAYREHYMRLSAEREIPADVHFTEREPE